MKQYKFTKTWTDPVTKKRVVVRANNTRPSRYNNIKNRRVCCRRCYKAKEKSGPEVYKREPPSSEKGSYYGLFY